MMITMMIVGEFLGSKIVLMMTKYMFRGAFDCSDAVELLIRK